MCQLYSTVVLRATWLLMTESGDLSKVTEYTIDTDDGLGCCNYRRQHLRLSLAKMHASAKHASIVLQHEFSSHRTDARQHHSI